MNVQMIGIGKWIMCLLRVTEKEVWEALKRMKKGKSFGPNEVSCEMFSNEVCVKELCGVANDLLMGENMSEL